MRKAINPALNTKEDRDWLALGAQLRPYQLNPVWSRRPYGVHTWEEALDAEYERLGRRSEAAAEMRAHWDRYERLLEENGVKAYFARRRAEHGTSFS